MKLISCRIENFGKYDSKEIFFSDGINCFLGDNGSGKSTIASFLRACFYGLPTDRVGSGFNDRAHYFPFSVSKNAAFGGNVVFEMKGNRYRIERRFDQKSTTKDELHVYRNGTETGELGEVPGEAVFRVGESSFKNTVFFDADDLSGKLFSAGTAPDINGALGGSYSDRTGGVAVKDALDRLAKKSGSLQGRTKSKTGLIPALEKDAARIRGNLSALEKKSAEIEGLYKKRSEIFAGVKKAEAELEDAVSLARAGESKRTLQSLSAGAGTAKKKLSGLIEKYPGGLPSEETAEELETLSRDASFASKILGESSFPPQKAERLSFLEAKYPLGVPAEEETLRMSALEAASAKPEKSAELIGLETKYGEKDVTGTLARARAELETATERGAAVRELTESPDGNSRGGKVVAAAAVLLAAAVAALVCAFIPALSLYKTPCFIAAGFFAVCALSLITARVISRSRARAEKQRRVAELRSEKKRSEEKIRELLVPFGFYSEVAAADVALFGREAERFGELKEEYAKKLAAAEKSGAELSDITAKYRLSETGITGEVIRADAREISSLRSDREDDAARRKRAAETLDGCKKKISDIYASLCLPFPDIAAVPASVALMRADSAEFERLSGEAERLEESARKFAGEHPEALAELPDELPDPEPLRELAAAGRRELGAVDESIRRAEEECSEIPALREELSRAEEDLAAAKRKKKILDAAEGALRAADKALKDRYIAPVRDIFRKNASAIAEALGSTLDMDENYRILFESDGMLRQAEHLSKGQQAVCALCFRVALADNIYGDEKPFLIFDDPFESLDETNMKNTANLISRIASDYQILYFCAHPSRVIGEVK